MTIPPNFIHESFKRLPKFSEGKIEVRDLIGGLPGRWTKEWEKSYIRDMKDKDIPLKYRIRALWYLLIYNIKYKKEVKKHA